LISEAQQKNLVRDRFTRTAEVFGAYAVAERAREAQRLAGMLSLRGDEKAADIACGPGTLALPFAQRVRWICGVDFTPAMIERARRSAQAGGIANVGFALGDAHALPFADRSLDVVVTSYSLHHMADAPRVLAEMARVVRRGGRMGVIDIRALENAEGAEMANRIERLRDPSHTRALSGSEIERLFAAHGLRILAVEIEEHPRSFNHWLSVAGWKPGDPAYEETRRLMESTIENDAAGFHPRYGTPDAAGVGEPGRADLQMVNTVLYVAAEKAA